MKKFNGAKLHNKYERILSKKRKELEKEYKKFVKQTEIGLLNEIGTKNLVLDDDPEYNDYPFVIKPKKLNIFFADKNIQINLTYKIVKALDPRDTFTDVGGTNEWELVDLSGKYME